MSRSSLAVAAGLTLAAVAHAAEPAPKPKTTVAVLPLKASGGVKQDVADVVTSQLAAAIQHRNFSVMAPNDLQAKLGFERQKELLGCTDTSCLVEVGAALGVDRLVSGTIAFVGQSVVIDLALINNNTGAVEYRYAERVKQATEEVFLDLIPKAVVVLFPEGEASSGEAVRPSAGMSGKRVAAWVTAGVGAAAIVGGIVSFAMVSGFSSQLKASPPPANAAELQAQGQRWLYGGIAAFAVGGALAITSVILFLTSSDAPAVSVVPTSSGALVVFGGSF